jgi:hypothetical protein
MATSRRSVELPTEKSNGDQPAAAGLTESPARGTRPDGSGSNTPNDRTTLAGSGEVPDRGLKFRDI